MDDKIVKISFNVWANDEAEGEELRKMICDFVDCQGSQGRKVTARKLCDALGKWQSNPIVKTTIINHFK